MLDLFKRLFFALRPSKRMMILDYPVETRALFSKDQPHRQLFKWISENDSRYARLLQQSVSHWKRLQEIPFMANENDETPSWKNKYLPGLDIVMLYTILHVFRPAHYVEIGSGTSTKVAHKVRNEHGLTFRITSIDPNPRQEIKNIADTIFKKPVQQVSLSLFTSLKEDDIVFFDGTHVMMPHSDVTHFFLQILPALPRGVIVQVHDIYLPYDYPAFMLERFYNENYVLAAVLLANPQRYELLAPLYYISEQPHLAKLLKPFWDHPSLQPVERHGGSFWFRIK